MSPEVTIQRFRKRYFIVAAFAVLLGIGLSPAFQSWVCRFALNQATLKQGFTWSVDAASIGLFPPAIEMDGVHLTHLHGTDLRLERIAVDFAGSPWRVKHLLVEGLEGVLVGPEEDTSLPQSPRSEPLNLLLDAATVSNAHVEVRSNDTAALVEWEDLSLENLHINGARINGDLLVPHAEVSPRLTHGNSLSGAWDAPVSIEGIEANVRSDDSLMQFTIQAASNLGHLAMEWNAGTQQHTVAFAATPSLKTWPIYSDHWLHELRRLPTDSTITGEFTWNAQTGVAGFLSQTNLQVPLAFRGSSWNFGPINVHADQLAFLADLAGVPLPAYLSAHHLWVLEGAYDGANATTRLSPEGISNQRITLAWNTRDNPQEVTASIHGFSLDAQGQDLRSGQWDLTGRGKANETGWNGNLMASHPDGDAITTEWKVELEPSGWSFTTDTRVEQLVPKKESSSPWELYAHIEWRGSGTDSKNWIQVLEMRDIVLLQNRVPRTFDRFDAIQKRSGDAWSLEWASAITSGNAQCNTALLTEWSFNSARLAFEPKIVRPSSPPVLDVQVQVANLQPIALLTDLPLDIPEAFAVQASWDGSSGFIQTDISSMSFASLAARDLTISGSLSAQEHSLLNWEAHDLTFNNESFIQEISGQLEAGSEGMELAIQTCTGQLGPEAFALERPAFVLIDAGTGACSLPEMALQSSGGAVQFAGGFNHSSLWNLEALIAHDGFHWDDELAVSGIDGNVAVRSGSTGTPRIEGSLTCSEVRWNEFAMVDVLAALDGTFNAPRLRLNANALPSGSIQAAVDLPLNELSEGRVAVAFRELDLAPVNGLLPPGSIELFGTVSGQLNAQGLNTFPRIEGQVVPRGVELAVPYLGTRYQAEGIVKIESDGFFMDQWTLSDKDSAEARFNGTVLHDKFEEWDLDFGIEIKDRPIELMNIPITDDALFYGTARGTGDLNVSGYGPILEIDATLKTGPGTDFALPMDSRSDVDYADFVRFRKNQVEAEATTSPRGTFSNTRLNLGIDVNEKAQARIVFDRKVGDEIVGNTTGHIDLEVNDFEQLDMTGNLEITEGAYYFTLQNWVNKRFDIQPGSTVSWSGDPYDAQLKVFTTYTTRTELDPLLPEIDDLPGRLPVELQLELEGSLLRPGLDFNVEVPTADSRIQALVEGALISEEEVQRQALGLLTINQFIPSDPSEAAIGGFIQPAQSTQFLANQLGHWISQIAPSMDVGLDYAQNALSGEQAVGLALSTQLLNDRLHIEGEVGAQTFGTVQAEDFQIQDLTVSFDLTDDGAIQLTGHTRQNASLTNAIEGDAVQGVGIRFNWAFDKWGEWKD